MLLLLLLLVWVLLHLLVLLLPAAMVADDGPNRNRNPGRPGVGCWMSSRAMSSYLSLSPRQHSTEQPPYADNAQVCRVAADMQAMVFRHWVVAWY
jgi:hypothetical protein